MSNPEILFSSLFSSLLLPLPLSSSFELKSTKPHGASLDLGLDLYCSPRLRPRFTRANPSILRFLACQN